jgi:hypothetical protein
MQRFGAWIEPSIIAEWTRLMKGYATWMDRRLDAGAISAAVTWIEPDRDVAIARARALALVENGSLFCVWSGRKLDASTLDMDHALPWSAWPCGDLWNLVPAHRRVNQDQKRDKLPSGDLLIRRRDSIVSWWHKAYEQATALAPQFVSEAKTSLPALGQDGEFDADDIFEAMRFQRLRLWRDQQIQEWDGARVDATNRRHDQKSVSFDSA